MPTPLDEQRASERDPRRSFVGSPLLDHVLQLLQKRRDSLLGTMQHRMPEISPQDVDPNMPKSKGHMTWDDWDPDSTDPNHPRIRIQRGRDVPEKDVKAPDRNEIAEWIKKLGPVAATILPAIVLARGAGGRDIASIVRRFAPKHLKGAMESPHVYTFEDYPAKELAGVGPHYSVNMFEHLGPQMMDFVRSQMKELPETVGRLVTTLDNPSERVGGTLHEFGHLTGYDRVWQRLKHLVDPRQRAARAHSEGANQLDVLPLPKTQAFMRRELERRPGLAEYYAARRSTAGEPVAKGELLTEMWAQAMQRKGGVPHPEMPNMTEYGWTGRVIAERLLWHPKIQQEVEAMGSPVAAQRLRELKEQFFPLQQAVRDLLEVNHPLPRPPSGPSPQ